MNVIKLFKIFKNVERSRFLAFFRHKILYVDPDLRHVRIVQIEKPVNGLGFNIVGGEVDHQGTTLAL